MGLLKLFAKPQPSLLRLPSGSFTVDRLGTVLVETLPSNFPRELVEAIAKLVLKTFKEAGEAQLHLAELSIHYPSLKITARELRGGALIFLRPMTSDAPPRQPC